MIGEKQGNSFKLCMYRRYAEGRKMRRKCFAVLLVLIALLSLADAVGLPLKNARISAGSEEVLCKGKVISVQEEENRITLRIRLKSLNGEAVHFSEDVLGSLYRKESSEDSKNSVKAEDFLRETISFRAVLKDAAEAGNPHCFDYRKYLKSTGIGKIATIKAYDLEESRGIPPDVLDAYEKAVYRAKSAFLQGVSQETRGMISGVLFGDTSFIEDAVYEEFRGNGTAHILAVSGLHIGILYGIYKKLAGRRRSVIALGALLGMLFLYGSLAMWSTSSCRAILMIIVSVLGRYMDRRRDMLTSMSVAAFILIAQNPYVIFGASFQMSFLAITSIAFLRPVMPDVIPESLSTAFAVNLGLLAYQMYNFNYISIVSILANIPIIYMTGYFVPTALLGFCAFRLGFGWELMRPIVEGFALMLEKTNHLMNFGGHSGSDAAALPFFAILFLICGIFFVASERFYILRKRKDFKRILWAFTIIFAVSAAGEAFTYSPITHDDLIFVDVGQGDCMHIKAGGKNILIDGGGSADYNVGKNKLKPYLLKNGVSRLEGAVATHRHTDHYKGLTELREALNEFEIYTEMTAGRKITLAEEVYIETLWPLSLAEGQLQEENKDCSVFMLHYNGYKTLITGDLDREGEAEMLRHYGESEALKADVLKVGHHGSKTSTSAEFLQAVAPKVAVIQVGQNNYGHPTAETLQILEDFGCLTLRNDLHGAVGIRFDGDGLSIHTNFKADFQNSFKNTT